MDFKLTMSQESDSDPELDFDSAWNDKFGEERAQAHNKDSSPHVNEDGYDDKNIDFENEAQLRFERLP